MGDSKRKEGRETYLEVFPVVGSGALLFFCQLLHLFPCSSRVISSNSQCGSFFLSYYLWPAHPNVSGQLE